MKSFTFILLYIASLGLSAQDIPISETKTPRNGNAYSTNFTPNNNENHYEASGSHENLKLIAGNDDNNGETIVSYIEPISVSERELDFSKAVGSTAGAHSVSLTGGATYQIPISIPPGIRNMQPNISLVYNSQGGNGLLGMGWSLSGLSSITRVPHTHYHDGQMKEVNFNDDRFALDGQRLINVSGETYGDPGCVYYTEIFNGSKITSYGTAGIGPAYFIVETKDGLTIEFGNTEDSRIEARGRDGDDVLVWAINKIYDKFGNYVKYQYMEELQDYTSYRPYQIIYTCNDEQDVPEESLNTIRFEYTTRDDVSTSFISGSKVKQWTLINKIKVFAGSEVTRTYELEYAYDMYSHLVQVTETGKDGLAYNSTIFEWAEKPYNHSQGSFFDHNSMYDYMTGDFNGDGRSDVIACEYHLEPSTGKKEYLAYTIFDNDDNCCVLDQQSLNDDYRCIIVGDYNGDGKSDLILVKRIQEANHDNYSYVKWLANDDQEFELLDKNNYLFQLLSDFPEDEYPFRHIQSADFNGDGQDDIMCDLQPGYATSWIVHHMTNEFSVINPFPETYGNQGMEIADFNGDGKADVMTLHTNGSAMYEFIDEGQGQGHYAIFFTSGYPTQYHKIYTGDFNGDGKADVLTWSESTLWELFYFKGEEDLNDEWEEIAEWPSHTSIGPNYQETLNYHVADFNGDGKADILESFYYNNQGFEGQSFTIYEFNGLIFNKYQMVPEDYLGIWFDKYSFGDFSGNGALEMLVGPEDDGFRYSYYFYLDKNQDHIIASANGLNQKTFLSYQPLTNNDIYEKNTGTFASTSGQVRDIQAPLYVVSEIETDDGIGGENSVKYYYEGARVHRFGKGFLGFSKTTQESPYETNDLSGEYSIQNITEYDNPSPFFNLEMVGQLSQIKKEIEYNSYEYIPLSQISEIEYAFSYPTGSDQDLIFYPYISDKTTTEYTKNIEASERVWYDDWANLTYQVSELTGGIRNTTSFNNYVAIGGSFCPNKPENIIKTQYRADKPPFEQGTNFVYDDGSGLLLSSTQNPESDQPLTVSYTYDDLGNTATKTIYSPDLEPRTTTYAYEESGRFVKSITNSLGHDTWYFTDPCTGQHLTIYYGYERWNGLYDGLGKLREERTSSNAPQGYSTNTIRYQWYQENEIPNAIYSIKTEYFDGAEEIAYYDMMGRVVVQGTKAFDGQMIYSNNTYNSNGEQTAVSETYFAGSEPRYWTHFKYDIYGRLEETYNPVKHLSYTYNGLTTTVLDHYTQISNSKTTDAAGLIISASDPGGTIVYSYFSHGQPEKISAPDGAEFSFKYDEYGRQIELNDPDAGTTMYQYNAYGEIEWQRDARGNETVMYYDILGRIDAKVLSDGTITDYIYDTRPNGKGKLSSVTYSNGISYDYYYGDFGDIRQRDETIDEVIYSSQYTYDEHRRIQTYSYPSGFGLRYHYNDFGYTESISRTDNGNQIYRSRKFNQRGQLSLFDLGDELTKTTYVYDTYGFMEKIQTIDNNQRTLQDLEYDFDIYTGNLNYRKDKQFELQEDFVYSDNFLNRLNSWQVDENEAITASYYDNGNIDNKSDLGTYSYPDAGAHPHAVTSITEPIQLPAEANQSITYTVFNKVERINHHSKRLRMDYTYGPDLSRKKTEFSENGILEQTKYFIGGNYEIEKDAEGNERLLHYISSDAGLIAILEITQQTKKQLYYVHKDHLGSLQCISTENLQVMNTLSFDPWGNRRNVQNWQPYDMSQPLLFDRGFTGHQHLDAFGLINMNGRMYDPVLGRFLSPDNYVQAPENSQNLNRYSYCLNNPLIYTDPSGEFWHIVIGAAVGGVINLAVNWNNIDNFGEGLAAFGVGAGAGALTAATGGAAAGTFMASTGAAFGAAAIGGAAVGGTNNIIGQTGNGVGLGDVDWGQVGMGAAVGGVAGMAGYGVGSWASNNLGNAIVNGMNVSSPMLSQGINGMVGGAAGGYAGGFTSGLLFSGGDLDAAFQGGWSGLKSGAIIGGGAGLGSGYIYAKQNNLNIWNGKSLTPKYDFTPDAYGDNITMYRGTTGSEGKGGSLFMTDNPDYAATYVQNGGRVVSVTIPRSTYMQMQYNQHIQTFQGGHGGSYGYEYQIHPSVVPNFLQLFK